METFVHQSKTNPALLTRSEAADKLRISKVTLDKLISNHKLPAVSIGRRKLISSEQLTCFIQNGGDR